MLPSSKNLLVTHRNGCLVSQLVCAQGAISQMADRLEQAELALVDALRQNQALQAELDLLRRAASARGD